MTLPSLSLKGKVAAITGGRRGLGRAIALGFAEAGADVAVCDIVADDGKLDEVVREICKFGQRGLAVQADVSLKADVDRFIKRVIDQLGTIDILVNNALATIRGSMLDVTEDGWDKVLDTDLKAYFFCSQAAARKMVEQRSGNIINIESSESVRACAGSVGYTIAMAGREMLTRVLAMELGKYNIRVNGIAPHLVKTEMTEMWWSVAERLNAFLAEIPLGRIGQPEDVVGAALYLASDASSWVTGNTIAVDGGYLAGDYVLPKARVLEEMAKKKG